MAFLTTNSLCFFFSFFMVLLSFSTISDARRFGVGGSGAWVPNPLEDYGSWAGKSRFLVHDTLYFTYAKGADSVLEVNKADYDGCNTKNPIMKADDGNSEISLDRSGPFYFISGNEDNCKKGQKLTVVVLSVRTATPPGSMPPKSSSPVSPATSPPVPMPPTSSAPVTSPPGFIPPKSSSPVSPSSAPVTSPPGSMAPKSSSHVSPMTSPPSPQPPKSSSPSSAPGSSPSGSMAPKSSSAGSPSLAPGESPSTVSSPPSGMGPSGDAPSGSAMGPSGSEMGPSGEGPSTSGDINTPAGAPGDKKSSANGMAVMSVVTIVLSLVLTMFMSA